MLHEHQLLKTGYYRCKGAHGFIVWLHLVAETMGCSGRGVAVSSVVDENGRRDQKTAQDLDDFIRQMEPVTDDDYEDIEFYALACRACGWDMGFPQFASDKAAQAYHEVCTTCHESQHYEVRRVDMKLIRPEVLGRIKKLVKEG